MADQKQPREGVLEIYKLTVEMADRLSGRRAAANTFLLSVQAALIASLGSSSLADRPVAGAGMLLATAWWVLLRSYRDLNNAKFQVICEMEKELPVQAYSAEWATLKKDPVKGWRPRYAELGTVERVVPVVFLVLNALIFFDLI
jgi:hypothetical protein